jgi:hypothetical protein
MKRLAGIACAVALAAALAGCGDPLNAAPTAGAGEDQTVATGETVFLDGSGSADPNLTDTLYYQWVLVGKPAGSTAALANTTTAFTSFTADLAGTYVVALGVNDGLNASDADYVTIVADSPPEISTEVSEHEGAAVVDASATEDPEGDAMLYSWTLASRPAGSAAELALLDDTTAYVYCDLDGAYEVGLTVGDGTFESTATVSFTWPLTSE